VSRTLAGARETDADGFAARGATHRHPGGQRPRTSMTMHLLDAAARLFAVDGIERGTMAGGRRARAAALEHEAGDLSENGLEDVGAADVEASSAPHLAATLAAAEAQVVDGEIELASESMSAAPRPLQPTEARRGGGAEEPPVAAAPAPEAPSAALVRSRGIAVPTMQHESLAAAINGPVGAASAILSRMPLHEAVQTLRDMDRGMQAAFLTLLEPTSPMRLVIEMSLAAPEGELRAPKP
jgi:hypothetical protein